MNAEQERFEEARERKFSDASHPQIGLLSNGQYSVMITAAGSGWGAWGNIDAAPPHTGRGGWTWYTGSAGWLYRVALEAILGIHPAGNTLRVDPCVPREWPGFEVTYRHGTASYRIRVENPAGVERGVRSVTVDGQPVSGGTVPLLNDSCVHDVRVELG